MKALRDKLGDGYLVRINDVYYGVYESTKMIFQSPKIVFSVKCDSPDLIKMITPHRQLVDFNCNNLDKMLKIEIINYGYYVKPRKFTIEPNKEDFYLKSLLY